LGKKFQERLERSLIRFRAPIPHRRRRFFLLLTTKRLYFFEEGSAEMSDALGGKGAGLAEMTRAGLPVPPGFTITTQSCLDYYKLGRRFPEGLDDEVASAMREL
jgi:hypothetical protein